MKQEYKIGVRVKCVNGRFEGCEGIISYFDPIEHDTFCMRVFPDVGERVNPGNWVIESSEILQVDEVDSDGTPLFI